MDFSTYDKERLTNQKDLYDKQSNQQLYSSLTAIRLRIKTHIQLWNAPKNSIIFILNLWWAFTRQINFITFLKFAVNPSNQDICLSNLRKQVFWNIFKNLKR